ncbi:MAG: excinuclease ABC subunit UvrA [Rikenellaceae bacterium]
MKKSINIEGARVHNLKNIDLEIPRQELTVITGLSGSGKSSLAFDTIYAEGQRRYLETLGSYSRQFIGNLERPDVDMITGLSPVIAIEQKTVGKNPRSTVGTITEIYDYLRLLYAKAATAYSTATGEEMVSYSTAEIVATIARDYKDRKIAILSPIVKGRKGHYRETFERLRGKGFVYARIDGEVLEMTPAMQLDRYTRHNIELVIDRLRADERSLERIEKSVKDAFSYGEGTIAVSELGDSGGELRYFSRSLMCPTTGLAYQEPQPATFSFNSPFGACPACSGLGVERVFDTDKLLPDMRLSIDSGAIEPLKKIGKTTLLYAKLEALAKRYGYDITTPLNEWEDEAIRALINGEADPLMVKAQSGASYMTQWEGVLAYMERLSEETETRRGKKFKEQFIEKRKCNLCGGTRLKAESLAFKVADKNIAELSAMSIERLSQWVANLEGKLSTKQQKIAHDILFEIGSRLGFLLDVGLSYLSLSRPSGTLSGGESQRIRLATQVGSKLINVLYILDEPSIGLHPRDNVKLIHSLEALRDVGNSVIVVEHDELMIRSADFIVDVGPLAGRKGGEIVSAGTLDTLLKSNSLTAQYLNGTRKIEVPQVRRTGNGKELVLTGCKGNNLKDITLKLPLGCLVAVAGVSGSGKSTLINHTLRPILAREYFNSYDVPLEYDTIEGVEHLDKIIVVDQSQINRSPRSNPATYSTVFTDIRNLFEKTTDAQTRGFKARSFSFNVKGGRCEACKGAGVETIEMNFLPDVYVKCKVCDGHRYNPDTLTIKYKGRNINDVLEMTINQAVEFFENLPSIYQKLRAMQDVGLGYIRLGQPCTTLSGGERQRLKLSAELAKRDTGMTLYVLDEPTTGLHFEDVRVLNAALQKLVDRGNTVVVIEHNTELIKCADYVIDMGPDGGDGGGEILACGTPEELSKMGSVTGVFLD